MSTNKELAARTTELFTKFNTDYLYGFFYCKNTGVHVMVVGREFAHHESVILSKAIPFTKIYQNTISSLGNELELDDVLVEIYNRRCLVLAKGEQQQIHPNAKVVDNVFDDEHYKLKRA